MNLVVRPGQQDGLGVSAKLRRPSPCQRGVKTFVAPLAQLLQRKGPLGELEEEVARKLKGAELADFGCSPPRPVEGPERAGDHAPSLSRRPHVCPQLSRLSRPSFAGGRRLQELEAELQGDGVDGCRLDRLGRRGVVARLARGQIGALHRAAADAAGVAVRGQPLGHPRPHVAGGLVLQVFAELPMTALPLLELLHGDGQALIHVVAAVASLGGLRDARANRAGEPRPLPARPGSSALLGRAA